MAKETEAKVLGVDKKIISKKLAELGAHLVQDTTLLVDWYGSADIYGTGKIVEGNDQWYLRIRSNSEGKTEMTWKGKSDVLGASRSHEEINLMVSDMKKAGDFLSAIGLINYAHQEKKRTSWTLKDWRFDLDTYPDMPPYLEIEGKDEAHIQEALAVLSLLDHKTSPEGERKLIQNEYGLNWYNMRF
jgi:adenylate cyclase class 2